MGYEKFAIHRFQGANGPRFVKLPDIYENLESVGLTKVEDDINGSVERLIDILRNGGLKRVRIRVAVTANDVRSRSIYCDASAAETVLGSLIGKAVTTNGTVQGGGIQSASFPRRRTLR